MKGLHATSGEGCRTGQGGYEPPSIRDHGTLTQITADQGMLFDVTRVSVRLMAAAVSTPLVPGSTDAASSGTPSGTPSSGVLGSSGALDPTSTSTTPGAGGVLENAGSGTTDPSTVAGPGGNAGAGESGGGGGGSGGGSGSGSGGGRLPFTGLAVIGIAAVGAAATGAGAAMRRMLRRNKAPGAGP